jgi:lactate racemase
MMRRVSLAYGRRPLEVTISAGARVVPAPVPPAPPAPARELLERALDAPMGSAGLEDLGARRVLVIVSDATRADPRAELLGAVLRRLPPTCDVTVAIATGTHAPGDVAALGLPADPRIRRVVNHDGRADDLVELGTTRRGTPVRVNPCLLATDLIVATGCIRPHYFAGYGAGVKAIFPGLGGSREVRKNHRLKREPRARAGVVEGNPCRGDLEECVPMLPAASFLLNLVVDPDEGAQSAVAGDVVAAFRIGAARCDPLARVAAPRARVVVVSGRLPVVGSLYQASKLVAAAAPLVTPGGAVVLAAECPHGTGPIETVNEGIYEIGIRPRLPAKHRVVLVSSLGRAEVERSYCGWAASVEEALAGLGGDPDDLVVLPRADGLIVEAEEDDHE